MLTPEKINILQLIGFYIEMTSSANDCDGNRLIVYSGLLPFPWICNKRRWCVTEPLFQWNSADIITPISILMIMRKALLVNPKPTCSTLQQILNGLEHDYEFWIWALAGLWAFLDRRALLVAGGPGSWLAKLVLCEWNLIWIYKLFTSPELAWINSNFFVLPSSIGGSSGCMSDWLY